MYTLSYLKPKPINELLGVCFAAQAGGTGLASQNKTDLSDDAGCRYHA